MALNNMKEYRIEKKLSMKDLSFSTGISERYLYFIENGERNPSIATARKISNVLGKSINDIFLLIARTKSSYIKDSIGSQKTKWQILHQKLVPTFFIRHVMQRQHTMSS